MKELTLKYGCNPSQKPARVFMREGELPITVLNGAPGYINLLDALNGWQLVRELSDATGLPAATSFKHVSPAGAAVGLPLSDTERAVFRVKQAAELSPLACAYARARGADRMSSFGDFISLSHKCDEATAKLVAIEVSDGIVAPSYTLEALEILKKKRGGGYCVLQIDADYIPAPTEYKDVYGLTFEQGRNEYKLTSDAFSNIVSQRKELPEDAKRDLLLAMITLKYTQSNSVCYAKNGMAVGIGAGQQSRIHCVRLAGQKADQFFLRHHERILNLPFKDGLGRAERDNAADVFLTDGDCEAMQDSGLWRDYFSEKPVPLSASERRAYLDGITGVSLGSDAFFPFSDNIERARRSGVEYILEPGGSIRDDAVIAACDKYGMVLGFTGMRLFHH